MKGVSPLLASVLLITLVILTSIIINSFFTSLTQTQQEKAISASACSQASMIIEEISCSNNVLKAVIHNTGDKELKDFSVYAKIGGNLIVNNTPFAGSSILNPGESTTVEIYTTSTGEIEEVKVYAQNCPGIYGRITNETEKVAC